MHICKCKGSGTCTQNYRWRFLRQRARLTDMCAELAALCVQLRFGASFKVHFFINLQLLEFVNTILFVLFWFYFWLRWHVSLCFAIVLFVVKFWYIAYMTGCDVLSFYFVFIWCLVFFIILIPWITLLITKIHILYMHVILSMMNKISRP